ncbi:uncharacterized protein LOC110117610 isoform X2 [Ceratitis capitata]|uniref:uncharacterized protein LOC110117610 isoform X2 n=1 Tax=Ceratitis capitata TaxID=7213 RepID=UPI000A0F8EA3|nr:uncharacterized protein LOC110117610 isoform X2 [Ceratitis capitata]
MVSFMNRQIDADVQVGEHPEGKQQAENHKRYNTKGKSKKESLTRKRRKQSVRIDMGQVARKEN